jgi:hypothetical protein
LWIDKCRIDQREHAVGDKPSVVTIEGTIPDGIMEVGTMQGGLVPTNFRVDKLSVPMVVQLAPDDPIQQTLEQYCKGGVPARPFP